MARKKVRKSPLDRALDESKAAGRTPRIPGGPPPADLPEPDDAAKRKANRERVARARPVVQAVSRDPRFADKRRDRWGSRDRALRAAAENRMVQKGEEAQRAFKGRLPS
jgi:hypothetical protein